MSQGLYGSICIEDLFGNAIQRDQQGNAWVNLAALQGSAIKRGERNGKTYVNIGVWINDQQDQYGNIAGISISQSQEERQSGAKRVYIGNLKQGAQQQAQQAQQAPPAATPWGGQPAQPQYAQPQYQQTAPQQPAPQQVQQAQAAYYPQQAAPAPAPAAPATMPYAGNNDLPF